MIDPQLKLKRATPNCPKFKMNKFILALVFEGLLISFAHSQNTVQFSKADFDIFGSLKTRALEALHETSLEVSDTTIKIDKIGTTFRIAKSIGILLRSSRLEIVVDGLELAYNGVTKGKLSSDIGVLDLSTLHQSLNKFNGEIFDLNAILSDSLISGTLSEDLVLIAYVEGLKPEGLSQLRVATSNKNLLLSYNRDIASLILYHEEFGLRLRKAERIATELGAIPIGQVDMAVFLLDINTAANENTLLLARLNTLKTHISERLIEAIAIEKLLSDAISHPAQARSAWESWGGLDGSVDTFTLSFQGIEFSKEGIIDIQGPFQIGTLFIHNLHSTGTTGSSTTALDVNLARYVTIPGLFTNEPTTGNTQIDVTYNATDNTTGNDITDGDFLSIPSLGISVKIPEGGNYQMPVLARYDSPLRIIGGPVIDSGSGTIAQGGEFLWQPLVQYIYSEDSGSGVRNHFEITNYGNYPNSLFVGRPDLPPCGSNASASRTWLEILDKNNNYIYGFCSIGASIDLRNLWFYRNKNQAPVEAFKIRIRDRSTGIQSESSLISVPHRIAPAYQPDLSVGFRGANAYRSKSDATKIKIGLKSKSRATFNVALGNDGDNSDALSLFSRTRGRSSFRFSYSLAGRNVTGTLTREKVFFETVLSQEIKHLKVSARKRGKRGGGSLAVGSESSSFPWRIDSLSVVFPRN